MVLKNNLFSFSLCLIPLTVGAAIEPESVQLNDMVVTSTGYKQSINDVQASIEVINRDRFKALSLRTLAQVLQYATGVFVRDTGSTSNVAIRGVEPDQVLILVDGLRRTGKFGRADFTGLMVENIERIEIVRGPMSALYGSDSVGGVINVITRKPDGEQRISGNFLGGTAEHRERNTFIFRGSAESPKIFDTAHRFSVEVNHKQPFHLDPDDRATELNDQEKLYLNYAGAYDYDAEKKLAWNFEYWNQDDQGIRFDGSSNSEEEQRYQGSMNYYDQTDTRVINIMGAYGNSDAKVNRSANVFETTDYSLGEINGFLTIFPFEDNAFTFSVGGRREEIEISTFTGGEQDRNVFHIAAQDEWNFFSDFKLLVGLRYDNFSDFGDSLNPRVSLSYNPGDFQFRFSYGEAFAAPRFLEMFSTFVRNSPRGTFTIQGNEDLGAESSRSYEFSAGYRGTYGSLQIAFHHTEIKDLIDAVNTQFTPGPRPTFLFEYMNVDKAEIDGIEVSLQFSPFDFWDIWSSYDYLDATDGSTGKRLLDRARHTARIQNTFHLHDQFDFHVNARTLINFIGLNESRQTSTIGHTELNLKLDFHITDEVTLYGGVDNILNEAQPFALGLQGTRNDPGARFYYLGLSARY